MRTIAGTALLLLAGCTFDGSGLFGQGGPDARGGNLPFRDGAGLVRDAAATGADAANRDGAPGDSGATPTDRGLAADTAPPLPPDAGPRDSAPPPPDAALVCAVIIDSSLGRSFDTTNVPCISDRGDPTNGSGPVADTNSVRLVDDPTTLATVPSSLRSWLGTGPWITAVWNPNACKDDSLTSAGLLIRGAQRLTTTTFRLSPSTTIADINFILTGPGGSYLGDAGGTSDATLTNSLQYTNAVRRAKELLLQLGACAPAP